MKRSREPAPRPGIRPALLCAALALLATTSCEKDVVSEADQLEKLAGDEQAAHPMSQLEPLVVRVLGPRKRDFLGRKGQRFAALGDSVTFEVDGAPPSPPEGIPGDARVPHPLLYTAKDFDGPGHTVVTVATAADGTARVWARLGTQIGDWEIDADIKKKGERVRFRLTSGVRIVLPQGEGVIGSRIPIGMELMRLASAEDAKLVSVAGRRINFRLISAPAAAAGTAKLKDKRNETDADGYRETELTLGDAAGEYQVLARVVPAEADYPADDRPPFAPFVIRVVATDWLESALEFAAGILVFVIGVRLLGSGFLLVTSPYMHLPTTSWAASRPRGFLGGTVAGAIFQSHSLVTSHLVSLANGGLLGTRDALGMLCGAALGGTFLAQILALDVSRLAAPFLLVGTSLFLWQWRGGRSTWASVFVGAGLILLGWDALDDAVTAIALSESFRSEFLPGAVDPALGFGRYTVRFFTYFLLAGLAACVLRTSNLLVVVAMLFAARGILTISTAVPIVLGANLGAATVLTLGSLGKRREARRLALSSLLLQFFGCLGTVFLSLVVAGDRSLFLRLVEWLRPGQLPLVGGGVEQYIATVHTLHNLIAGAFFLLFPHLLLAATDRLLRRDVTAEPVKPHHLDPQLLRVPALAIRQATAEVIYVTEAARKMMAEAFDSFRYSDLELSEQVVRRAEMITGIYREVSLFLLAVAENELTRRDASQVEVLQTATESLARIGELAERLRELTARKIEENVGGIEEIDRDLNETYDLVMAQFTNVLSLLHQRDSRTEESAVKLVERVAKLSSRVEAYWRQRIEAAEEPESPVAIHLQTVVYQEAFSLLFRTASLLAQIARRMRLFAPERL